MDQVVEQFVMEDFEFSIDDEATSRASGLTNLYPECEKTYSLTQDGMDQGTYQTEYFSIDTATGLFGIDIDRTYDPFDIESFSFTIEAVSTLSGSTLDQQFTVNIYDACDFLVMTPPYF
jgi:hypothetical protein